MDKSDFTEWQPHYSVGNALLDGQHKQLLQLCGRAIRCMEQTGSEGIAHFQDVLNELSDYVREHFNLEEAMLRECAFPMYEKHRQEHIAYQLKLTELLLTAGLGEYDRAGLTHCLSEWWNEHILHTDKQYVQYLRDTD